MPILRYPRVGGTHTHTLLSLANAVLFTLFGTRTRTGEENCWSFLEQTPASDVVKSAKVETSTCLFSCNK